MSCSARVIYGRTNSRLTKGDPQRYILSSHLRQILLLTSDLAKFTVAVRGYTVEEEDMMCLDLKVDFMKNPFPRSGW